MPRKAKAEKPDQKDEVVEKGENQGKDVLEQAKEVRGEEEPEEIKDTADPRNAQAQKLMEEAYPERKATDLKVEARADFLRKHGATPGNEGDGGAGSGTFKVEKADAGKEMYLGDVTCESIHGQTHERISAKFNLPIPSGEEYVWYAFKQYHPNAMREHFKIDKDNKTVDPLMRSRYE